MFQSLYGLVPVATSEAGMSLTAQNWNEVGTQVLSFHLDALLVKPSMAILQQLTSLKHYLGWTGSLILNASNLTLSKSGEVVIKSAFDGATIRVAPEDLMQLIIKLRPEAVVLPRFCLQYLAQLPEDILPLVSVADVAELPEQMPFGVYFTVNESDDFATMSARIKPWAQRPCYISGSISGQVLQELLQSRMAWVESDAPAHQGLMGEVYSSAGILNLNDTRFAHVFETIDASCKCPVCTQKLTQGYLHHLYANTPLLCQRYLIQHNVFWCQQRNEKFV